MDKHKAKVRAQKLKEEINSLRYRYHVLDDPAVTDEVYDSLSRELRQIEAEFPDLATRYSPTHRVGGKALDKFVKVRHEAPMLSLNDAFDNQELEAWEKRIRKLLPTPTLPPPSRGRSEEGGLEYFCELKLDGLAVSLIYDDGYSANNKVFLDFLQIEDMHHKQSYNNPDFLHSISFLLFSICLVISL